MAKREVTGKNATKAAAGSALSQTKAPQKTTQLSAGSERPDRHK